MAERLKMGANVYLLTEDKINEEIKESPGNYAFGVLDKLYMFKPKYIGRSDGNLRDEMLQQCRLKNEEEKVYTHFKYTYAVDSLEAYNAECDNYHTFYGQLDNEIHPGIPEGLKGITCPHKCGYNINEDTINENPKE